MLSGGCHCGTIRYEMSGDTIHHALCHCTDCRKASGAPAVSWGLVPREGLKISGSPKSYKSSEHGRRLFCGDCGTSLFYTTMSSSRARSTCRRRPWTIPTPFRSRPRSRPPNA